jgi:glycosyltransferase involved in cell wall biosynthesis
VDGERGGGRGHVDGLTVRVALVSREVYPLTGGGIGAFVAAAAGLLSTIAEVTIVTSTTFQSRYEQLRIARDPRLPPSSVRVAFVPEPTVEEGGGWYDVVQCYGSRVLERLRELYPDGGPEVIEFPDYLGEGFVTVQAAQALDRFLDGSCVCVRLHTSQEISMILNGHYGRDFSSQTRYELERYALAHADRLVWQGGDVLGAYQRFYGTGALAPAIRIRHPYTGAAVGPDADAGYCASSPLRVLYAGRLERRKGVQNLIRAVTGADREDLRLTLLGDDTPTGPLGVSMRELLRLAIADDARIEQRDAVDRETLAGVIREHDVVVVPSLWECWPYAALEALHLNRPVLATPVGGLVELVKPGASGWLARGTDALALEQALGTVLGRRAERERMIRGGMPRGHADAMTDGRDILDRYQSLAQLEPRRKRARTPSRRPPLVSAIVPYYRSAQYVPDTIESLLAQSYPRLEIVLVNDGSFAEEDWILAELAARAPVVVLSQMNRGLGAARNFGVSQTRGRYVFPLDADNLADPQFVARCVEILEHRQDVAYVTSWSRYIEADGGHRPGPQLGYEPLGNQAALISQDNVAGDAAAVIRRRVFDAGFAYSEELASYEDWHFYRELRRAGLFGAVIPERLLHYRVHEESMQARIAQPRRPRLEGEMRALLRENGMQWTSSSV